MELNCYAPLDAPLFASNSVQNEIEARLSNGFRKRLHVLGRAATPLLKMAERLHVLNNVKVDFSALE